MMEYTLESKEGAENYLIQISAVLLVRFASGLIKSDQISPNCKGEPRGEESRAHSCMFPLKIRITNIRQSC
jgi:hypothetical protein